MHDACTRPLGRGLPDAVWAPVGLANVAQRGAKKGRSWGTSPAMQLVWPVKVRSRRSASTPLVVARWVASSSSAAK
eukprot:8346273-Lingulodinium_polyedra.AAC.1